MIKTFFIRTYGCQMNELDSQVMKGMLIQRGLEETQNEEHADILIFNTCSIRDLAERKVFGKLGQLSRGKKKHTLIGIAGCMVMAKKETIFKKFPHVDFILGTNNISDLHTLIDEALDKKEHIYKISEKHDEKINFLQAKRDSKIKAYVSISRGCNNFCTYCVVPYTRGREISKPIKNILEECTTLVEKGYKEITLLGQNVNSFGKDFDTPFLFPDLLNELDKIPGLERIRFLTSHPKDITKDLMHAIADLPSVCEFVHFPMQAGSSRVLKKMNRHYTREEYLEKAHLIRSIIPNVSLGTDIIVGFPSETEEEFLETLSAFEQVRFSLAYIFAFSPRQNTAAEKFIDDVPSNIKQERLQKLMDLYHKISTEDRLARINTVEEVLVERMNKDNITLKGKTKRWDKVIFQGKKNLVGTLQKVKLESYNHQTFLGSLI